MLHDRTWTVHDIIMSKNPVIVDGRTCIPWGQLAQALLAWTFFSPEAVFQSSAIMCLLITEALRRKYHVRPGRITWRVR